MKKTLFTFLLILIFIGTSTNDVFASTIEKELDITSIQNDIQQEEIDRRMDIVFKYLNEYANTKNLENHTSFDIPVDENTVINATISNQEMTKTKATGRYTSTIKAKTGYTYTLTLSNVVGSGDITKYIVKYRTGIKSSKGTYPLTISSVSISGKAPSGYSLGTKKTWIGNYNGNIIVSTGGHIKYTRSLLSDKTLNFSSVKLGSLPNNQLVIDYVYSVN